MTFFDPSVIRKQSLHLMPSVIWASDNKDCLYPPYHCGTVLRRRILRILTVALTQILYSASGRIIHPNIISSPFILRIWNIGLEMQLLWHKMCAKNQNNAPTCFSTSVYCTIVRLRVSESPIKRWQFFPALSQCEWIIAIFKIRQIWVVSPVVSEILTTRVEIFRHCYLQGSLWG